MCVLGKPFLPVLRVSRKPSFCPLPSSLATSCFHFWFFLVHGMGHQKLLRQKVALLYRLTGQPSSSSLNVFGLELGAYILGMGAIMCSWVSDLDETSPEYQALLS